MESKPEEGDRQLSRLERFLRLFTDVRPGEGGTALLMFASVFLILCSYYFVKPLREGWIAISDVGGLSKMEVKAYSSFLQALVLLVAVAAYARLASRVDRVSLITRASLFCISNLVIFWVIYPGMFFEHLPVSGVLFYLWVGAFGVFVVAQFWTYAADVYDDERGRRLMPMIAIGATSGAAGGSWLGTWLQESGWIPNEFILLAAGVPLGLSVLLTRRVEGREAAARTAPPAPPVPREGRRGALHLVLTHRYLLPVTVITLLFSWVNTNGENLLFRVVQETLSEEAASLGFADEQAALEYRRDGTTLFYGDFFFWVNIVALLLQAFVASRLLKYGGFGAILLLLPVIALASYTAMALLPILAIVKVMKIAENATDYSINNTARHVLWLPVSSELKFRGKPTIDTLMVRLGDGFAALTAFLGVQVLALATSSYFVLNVGLVLVWLVFALHLVREHRRVAREGATDAV